MPVGLVRPEMLLVAPLALPWLLWFEYFRAGGIEGRPGRHRARPHKPLLAGMSGWLAVALGLHGRLGTWQVWAGFVLGALAGLAGALVGGFSGRSRR